MLHFDWKRGKFLHVKTSVHISFEFPFSHNVRYNVLENMLSTREKCRRLQRTIAANPDDAALVSQLRVLEECMSESKVTIQAIDIADVDKPMRILGVKCETSLAISLQSAVMFVIILGVRYIVNGAVGDV